MTENFVPFSIVQSWSRQVHKTIAPKEWSIVFGNKGQEEVSFPNQKKYQLQVKECYKALLRSELHAFIYFRLKPLDSMLQFFSDSKTILTINELATVQIESLASLEILRFGPCHFANTLCKTSAFKTLYFMLFLVTTPWRIDWGGLLTRTKEEKKSSSPIINVDVPMFNKIIFLSNEEKPFLSQVASNLSVDSIWLFGCYEIMAKGKK